MLLCYIDESGTPELPGTSSHYVLAGIAIPIAKWKTYEGEIRKLKANYGLANSEIHSAYIPRPIIEQNKIKDFEMMSYEERRMAVEKLRSDELYKLQSTPKLHKQYQQTKKNHKQTEEYIHLTDNERKQVLIDLSKTLGKWKDVRLFADCIDKVSFRQKFSDQNIEEEAFTQLISRFEQYLKIYSKTTKDDKCGILVHDNNPTMATRLTKLMSHFHDKGTKWTTIKNIIEVPFFVDSASVNMVQMADLCSFALRRYVEKRESYLFENIFKMADGKDGHAVGVRHFANQPCDCLICKSHK